MKPISFTVLFLAAQLCASATQVQDALAKPVSFFSQDEMPIGSVLQSLGRAHGISIVADPDVTGTVSVEMNNTTVKGVLDAILRPNGYFYEEQDGWISIERFRTVIYVFDYPQLSRSGSSNSSITLGGTTSSNGGGGRNGQSGGGGGLNFVGAGGGALGNAVNGGGQGGGSSDNTQISITQKNESDFWATIEAQIQGMLTKDEFLTVNRFSGIAQVRATLRTHREVSRFVETVNGRIGAQVEVIARIIEVRLNNAKKLGIDWNVAAFRVGGVRVGSDVVPPGETIAIRGLSGATNITQVNGAVLSADTFAGTVGLGKVDVVIRALQEQGNVRVTNQPRLRLLNNQTGYIKDATDTPFFSLNSQVTINAGGTAIGGAQPITQQQFEKENISIGLVVPITAQISDNDEITLDVTPVLTRLISVVTSPDKLQTAPVVAVKQTSTIVKVRSGETAIIGGLISDEDGSSQRKIPLLGDIPGLGRAFRSDGKTTSRTELVIMLTPTVIRHGAASLGAPVAAVAVATPPQAVVGTVESISIP